MAFFQKSSLQIESEMKMQMFAVSDENGGFELLFFDNQKTESEMRKEMNDDVCTNCNLDFYDCDCRECESCYSRVSDLYLSVKGDYNSMRVCISCYYTNTD